MAVAQITYSPFAIVTNMRGAFTKQSLCSVGIPAVVLSILTSLLVGDHLQQSGPSMAAILGLGDHLWQHNLPQMVRGDQLWQGTNCSVTGLNNFVHNILSYVYY